MGYQALLFCPDEKTARTVTQVLSELEFNVESCTEPFAAVKKLMGQHFDAVVVDCDNEQNATLLFKSARNSTSNQASLAVAVVEGQAGVAKAFRIGANLVLTKPINIEQAKGTLRVARGLLRKSEPAKTAAGATAASAATAAATKPVSPAKVGAPAEPAAVSSPFTPAKPAWPDLEAAASSNASARNNADAQDEDLLEINGEDSVAAPSVAATAAPESHKLVTPAGEAVKSPAAAAAALKPAFNASRPALGGGAASAPAPAREPKDTHIAEVPPSRPADADVQSKTAEAIASQSSSEAASAPTFTIGGADVAAESSGGGKTKFFLGIAAAAIVAVGAYAGWAHFHGRASEPENIQTEAEPATVVAPQTPKPSGARSSSAPATPKSATSFPTSQPAASSAKGHTSERADSDLEGADQSSAPDSTKSSGSASVASKAADAEAAAAPLVLKGGKVPTGHAKAGPDAPAPSMFGIAAAGASAPPPNLGSSEIAPRPLLQTLNVSQGVSRGLLIKKVQPIYPRNALAMRVTGAVELMATVSKTGDIAHVKVLSGDSQLTKAATDAVKQWKYKPYLLNGEPVEIQTQITINFSLPK
jgi:TonB family protein